MADLKLSSRMGVLVTHPVEPDGIIRGFSSLWAYYVKGFDSAHHCQACFKGALAKNFNTKTARSGAEIILERARDFPFVYVCGVASGPDALKGQRNLHLPLRFAERGIVERTTYNGYRIVVTNAEALSIPPLPDYWMGLPDKYCRCKNFRFGVAYFPHDVPELQQSSNGLAGDRELWRIQELFRGIVMSRVREGNLPVPRHLPRISRNMLREKESRWFPVPGMSGGFTYKLVEREGSLELIVESWSRLAEGSGMRHRVTATQAVLEAAGFV